MLPEQGMVVRAGVEQHRIRLAISSWRRWAGGLRSEPAVVAPLDGGLSNRSFLLEAGGIRVVLRLNAPTAPLPGIDRRQETLVWQAASAAGIAPALWYSDEQAGFLVSEFIEDEPQAASRDHNALLASALTLLERCHRLEVDAASIDYRAHVEHYWRVIESSGRLRNGALGKQRETMRKRLGEIIDSGARTGLCHHDPVKANFVGSADRLFLLDWEYAARGLVIMDYAALAVEWGIDTAVIATRSGEAPHTLALARSFYRYLRALWQETVLA